MAKKKKNDDKIKSLEETVSDLKQRFGEGSLMKLGEARKVDVDSISTGSVSLDIALGVGGVPRGRIIEIYGPESSGKTTLALHVVAEAQKKGGMAAFVDAEHALDPEYAKKIGVKVNDLLISQPDNGEQALQIVESLVKSRSIDVIIVDSVAALTPLAEIEGEIGDQHIGLQARLMSQALRKLGSLASKTGCIVIFINQIRMKIGVMFGNPETTPGGKALKFYSSVRIELRRRAQIKKGDESIGNRVKVKVVKNKVASPFKTTEFDIMFNEGISYEGDVINAGVKYGVVKKSNASYSYDKEKLGYGLEKAKDYLRENPKVTKKIISDIKKALKEQ
ncbi:MAG: recombinase RecA [Candidatus Portnoybacteria bacterium]|nr:recombinase RecA [Candidatus Portnoybacteria bacterium]